MEQQIPVNTAPAGNEVIYALHGKCRILGTETRTIGGQPVAFYKLEVVKSNLSRSSRQEPYIWLPVASAKEKGLRERMTQEECDQALAVLNSREYYFDVRENWNTLQGKLENSIRIEGGQGLAKAYSCLHVLRAQQIVPTPEVQKMFDAVARVLFREICETLQITPKVLEDKIRKGLRQKLLANQ